MTRLARLAIAHPRRTIAAWLVLIGALVVIGLGVDDRLHRNALGVPGTEASRAVELANQRFGERQTLIVLLRGPRPELDRQGRRLAFELDAAPELTVLAPWNPGAGRALRPERDAALLLVRADRPLEAVSRETVPRVRSTVERLISEPVAASVSGHADVATGIHENTVAAAERAERIAAPLLLLILLLVFRSPIAAALPLIVGLTTIGAGSGILELVNRSVDLNAVAVSMLSLMGLALGVDYGLVLVSRFREELDAGHGRERAALIAVQTAGRAIVYASVTLGIAMTGAFIIVPGALLTSAALGVLIALALSVLGALTALPAALGLLGPAVDRWRIGGVLDGEGRVGALALRALRRPVVAAVLVSALIIALAAPALALDSGSPTVRVLPEKARERADFEQIQRTLGGNWTAPYQITVAAPNGAVTEAETLRALARWQRQTARRQDVLAVLGPAEIARRARGLPEKAEQLAGAEREFRRAERDQRRLADGLARAGDGAQRLRSGLENAAEGADLLAAGGREGRDGVSRLAAGLAQALDGSDRLGAGLAEARGGARRLVRGAARVAEGAGRLEQGLGEASDGLEVGLPRVRELAGELGAGAEKLNRLREPAQIAERELGVALDALEAMLPSSKLDPAYRRLFEAVATAQGAITGRNPLTGEPVAPGYDGLDAALAEAVGGTRRAASGVEELASRLAQLLDGLDELETGAAELQSGGERLTRGLAELDQGLHRVREGSNELGSGLERLVDGSAELFEGTGRLNDGTRELAAGLTDGADRTSALTGGIERMHEGVVGASVRTRRLGADLGDSERLAGTLESGYFLIAALDSAPDDERSASTFAVNIERGGTAAQITVIPAREIGDPAGDTLRGGLERSLADLEQRTGLETRLGGTRAEVEDFDEETSGRYWLLVMSLVVATFAVLVVMLRSLVLPLIAVVLNLLTIAAAFGALTLLFQGDAPLGGPGFLDAIMVMAIFAIAFGLSIDYEVFMLARMREGHALTGTTDGAIDYGLRHTAHVITGGALIMTGVFVAFALSDIASLRQLGIGLTIAVLLDATVIRLVLLPAAMRFLGDRTWWLPRWLGRVLPEPRGEAGLRPAER